jgi:hypothetical protein
MGLGVGVGAAVGVAIGAHLGLAGVPWLVNVALAKLGLIAAGGLIAGGAAAIRLANRRERRQLEASSAARAALER